MMRDTLTIGTAGHIDHGKTALVRALTGVDTDRLPQERARGITIDLGFAHLDLDGARIGIVDVPGHERFIRNMLAGAAGIEAALLIVAADDSVMPQTREHLAILEMLGVEDGIIVITKTDLVEAEWLDLVEAELRQLAGGTFLDGAPIVRTSATGGVGIEALRREIGLLRGRLERSEEARPFRMPIDRCFVLEGKGTVVTGTIWSGNVRVEDEVELQPAGGLVKVRGLHSHATSAARLEAGQRAAINLGGVHHSEIQRGCELAAAGYLTGSRRLNARLRLLGGSVRALRARARVRLHLGTSEVVASVRLLESSRLDPGESGIVQLTCAEPVVATCGQRLVIREESPLVTIGGGAVLQPIASVIRRSQAERVDQIRGFESAEALERVASAIRCSPGHEFTDLSLARDADVEPGAVGGVVSQLSSSGDVMSFPSGGGTYRLVHRDWLASLASRIERWIERFHREQPMRSGVPAAMLSETFGGEHPAALEAALGMLERTEQITRTQDLLSLRAFEPALSPSQRAALERVLGVYKESGMSPPEIGRLATDLGEDPKRIRTVVQIGVDGGELVHLGGGLYMDAAAEREMRQTVERHLGGAGEMTMSELRDLLGTTRKYAVPLGEYLDRIGVTRRRGDLRVLARSAVSARG